MPDVDGFNLAQQVARDDRLGKPKVILLTSAGASAVKRRAASVFAARLAKPVKQSDLLDAIVTAFATPQPSRRQRGKAPRGTRGPVGHYACWWLKTIPPIRRSCRRCSSRRGTV